MAGVMLSWYSSSGLTRLVVSTGFLLDPERHVKDEDHMGTAQGPAELSLLVSPIKVTDTLAPTNHPVHHLNVPGGPHPHSWSRLIAQLSPDPISDPKNHDIKLSSCLVIVLSAKVVCLEIWASCVYPWRPEGDA